MFLWAWFDGFVRITLFIFILLRYIGDRIYCYMRICCLIPHGRFCSFVY